MLKYDKFKKYEVAKKDYDRLGFETFNLLGGENHKFAFLNGYGASVVKHILSRGNEYGLYELAVLKKDKNSGEYRLCYSTYLTDDVIGYLDNDGVLYYLQRIKKLKKEG